MEDKNPLVSVLISLYNVERFLLNKRLTDVREQTYSNIEIILVDDGSTDNTATLIEDLAREDKRIKTIHKENGGLGSARNVGLDAAVGEYVYFCDVDDDIHLDLIEKCVFLIQKYQADLLIFGFNEIYKSGVKPPNEVSYIDKVIECNDDLKKVFVDTIMLSNGADFVWNKFYSRSFIENHHFRFGNLCIQQDGVFNIKIYPHVNRMVISSAVLYDYYFYGSGNNRARYIPNRFNIYHSIYKQLTSTCTQWGVMDKHCLEFITQKFYKGLIATFLDNPFYKGCPYKYKDRKREFKEILSNPDVQDCLANMEGSSYFKGIKSISYYWLSYRLKSYEMLTLLRWLFNIGDRCCEMLKSVLK